MPEHSKRILLVESDLALRGTLRRFLEMSYQVEVAESGNDALLHMSHHPGIDLVLAEWHLEGMTGLDFVIAAKKHFPDTRFALMSRSRYDDHFHKLREHDIFQVIGRRTPFDFEEFSGHIATILDPRSRLGLAAQLKAGSEIFSTGIQTPADRAALVARLSSICRNYRPEETDVSRLQLACEELINNAVFHAFRGGDGTPKYRPGSEFHLEPGEILNAEVAHNDRYIGFAVRDNQGLLSPNGVMEKLERQITRQGLMDASGRGLYLAWTLSQRMIVTVEPGKLTEIVLLFSHDPPHPPRPLCINIVA